MRYSSDVSGAVRPGTTTPLAERFLHLAPLDAPPDVWPYVAKTDAAGHFVVDVASAQLRIERSGDVIDARQDTEGSVIEVDERRGR